jgi:hypothetical protein
MVGCKYKDFGRDGNGITDLYSSPGIEPAPCIDHRISPNGKALCRVKCAMHKKKSVSFELKPHDALVKPTAYAMTWYFVNPFIAEV